ncbi:pilus assembly FimT family protein [Roseateles paludis]|uniref:Prepilin-type N-terminal cleavage/methylation domain-containing protein n=1 Tax=Roseateles paludis TaxID=3145238 RepID=A0ABV0G7U5_9BURK
MLAKMMRSNLNFMAANTAMQRGVGLIEMAVVLVVGSIIAATVIPSMMDAAQRKKIIATANEISSLMGYARSESLNSGIDIDISFDTDAHTKGVSCALVATQSEAATTKCKCYDANISKSCKVGAGPDGGSMLRTFSIPLTSGITFSTNSLVWPAAGMPGRFSVTYPKLTTTLPDDLKVTISGTRGFKLRVDLSTSGRISICSPDRPEAGYPVCAS